MNRATVVGAGLAGCEAAWQLARRGVPVDLIDMKPERRTPAHSNPLFAELVCSNSLRSDELTNASGLLKAEMRMLGSLIMRAADVTRVPAGAALAVDRGQFAKFITDALKNEENIRILCDEIYDIPHPPAIIATGPLTSPAMSVAIESLPGVSRLFFFDAAAPIVTRESLDLTRVFAADRQYGGEGDYLNCPLNRTEYEAFWAELVSAETAPVHGFEDGMIFEGCMPVENMAKRGVSSLLFGPMKPVRLTDPNTGARPYAVVQLRRENVAGTLWNLVGFQTRLKFGEQKRVFGMIPGLANAEYARYGVMHRNTYLDSPNVLNERFEMRAIPGLYFAGQITGVEGYLPSAASGLVAGMTLARSIHGLPSVTLPSHTAIGALGRYVSANNGNYQPMGIQFGIIDAPSIPVRGKRRRAQAIAEHSIETMRIIRSELED